MNTAFFVFFVDFGKHCNFWYIQLTPHVIWWDGYLDEVNIVLFVAPIRFHYSLRLGCKRLPQPGDRLEINIFRISTVWIKLFDNNLTGIPVSQLILGNGRADSSLHSEYNDSWLQDEPFWLFASWPICTFVSWPIVVLWSWPIYKPSVWPIYNFFSWPSELRVEQRISIPF